jgi:hypothetical protein
MGRHQSNVVAGNPFSCPLGRCCRMHSFCLAPPGRGVSPCDPGPVEGGRQGRQKGQSDWLITVKAGYQTQSCLGPLMCSTLPTRSDYCTGTLPTGVRTGVGVHVLTLLVKEYMVLFSGQHWVSL